VGQRKVHNDGALETRLKNSFFKTFYLHVHFLLPIDVINDAIGQCFFSKIYCLLTLNFVTMGRLTADDRSLIWNLHTQKGWGSWCMMKDFQTRLGSGEPFINSLRKSRC